MQFPKKIFLTFCVNSFFLFFAIGDNHSDTTLIKKHLTNITKTEGFRNHQDLETLNKVAVYIFDEFQLYADSTYYQEYEVNGNIYKNVICVFGTGNRETVVVGAHYDVCGNQEGADDNASGVVGLLELARLLKNQSLNYQIELVAYSLEEPPYFRSQNMGSYIHANSLIENNRNVLGMLCLEMIGYFDDSKGSQDYPIGLLSLFYGKRGDYIALVNKMGKGKFSRKFSNRFKKLKRIRTKKITAPKFIQGIDFSDHLNYWKFGISAVMITDTAFYRNKNYHKISDTMEKLDLDKMSKVIDGVFEVLKKLK